MINNEPCLSDVFVYKIKVTDMRGHIRDYVGHVNLIR